MHIAPAKDLVCIDVPLKPDSDGYPPMTSEPLWAFKTGSGDYELRSIPFFALGLAKHDIVEAVEQDGRIAFKRVVRSSGHSTMHVTFFQSGRVMQALSDLERMGCLREYHTPLKLYAFNVPLSTDLRAVVTYLDIGQENGWWSVEYACMRR